MIEILDKIDIHKIKNNDLREYLYKSFKRLPEDYIYPDYGYFVVVDSFDELDVNTINLTNRELDGFWVGLLDYINMVEIDGEVIEILVFVDTDINVSFVMLKSILTFEIIEILEEFII